MTLNNRTERAGNIVSMSSAMKSMQQSEHMGQTKSGPERSSSLNPKRLVGRIFEVLREIYPDPTQFGKAYGQSKSVVDATMRSWESSDLVKLPAEWIKSGLDHCRSNEPWPPNCAQFIAICKPTAEKLGLLTADQAYHCATHDRVDNLDTATRLAAKNTGYYELRTLSKEKTWPLFKRNYEVVVRRILNGENLSADIPKGLPERPCEPSPSKDEIASARADILKFIAKNR